MQAGYFRFFRHVHRTRRPRKCASLVCSDPGRVIFVQGCFTSRELRRNRTEPIDINNTLMESYVAHTEYISYILNIKRSEVRGSLHLPSQKDNFNYFEN